VIPAKAGIRKKPWSPLAPPKAGKPGFRVKPGMTECIRLMSSCIDREYGENDRRFKPFDPL
ncbi:MAG: hypothetical protein ABII06_17105, partial [Pseudomonadota bacterium]